MDSASHSVKEDKLNNLASTTSYNLFFNQYINLLYTSVQNLSIINMLHQSFICNRGNEVPLCVCRKWSGCVQKQRTAG